MWHSNVILNMRRTSEIPWIHFGPSNLWHEHRSTMRGHWLSAFYHISLKREKSWVLSYFWHNIFWSLYHLVWCMCFQFRFLWLRKWLPNWFAGTRFIKVIALCWSQEKCQSRKVSFTVVFLFVALLQKSLCPLSSTPLQFCLSTINMICL